ncbi:MAG: hypothetical protein A2284_12185 [Deltaproteobacteria bacterium RIFOXYA12_FULL_61_11]|nr:MAG: hypothetical protein A2284_12185 [Deltaproteobacteria bacterium RIFOXYA12_FULL_61_11]
MLLDRRGGVVVKLFFSLGFLAIVGGLFWMYHNLFVEVVEDFVVVEKPAEHKGYTYLYFDATRWDPKYFWEHRPVIDLIMKSPQAQKIEGFEFYRYMLKIDAEEFEMFEENVRLFRQSNRDFVRRIFFDKAKADKKAVGRLYKWLFGVEPSMPDNFGRDGAVDDGEDADEEDEEEDGDE